MKHTIHQALKAHRPSFVVLGLIALLSLTSCVTEVGDEQIKTHEGYTTYISLKSAISKNISEKIMEDVGKISRLNQVSTEDFDHLAWEYFPNYDVRKEGNLIQLFTYGSNHLLISIDTQGEDLNTLNTNWSIQYAWTLLDDNFGLNTENYTYFQGTIYKSSTQDYILESLRLNAVPYYFTLDYHFNSGSIPLTMDQANYGIKGDGILLVKSYGVYYSQESNYSSYGGGPYYAYDSYGEAYNQDGASIYYLEFNTQDGFLPLLNHQFYQGSLSIQGYCDRDQYPIDLQMTFQGAGTYFDAYLRFNGFEEKWDLLRDYCYDAEDYLYNN